jgi:hypothetical protein
MNPSANPMSIPCSDQAQLREWLILALQGKKPLPKLTPDESNYLGVIRLAATQPTAQEMLKEASFTLLEEFCAQGAGEISYAEGLLLFSARQAMPEVPLLLAEFAKRFASLPNVSLDIRRTVLGILADELPLQSFEFWHEIFLQDRINHAGIALAGALAVNPFRAVRLLPMMPDDQISGEYCALNLDLAADELHSIDTQINFVKNVQGVLKACGADFAHPIWEWVSSKNAAFPQNQIESNLPSLWKTIRKALPNESAPKKINAKLKNEIVTITEQRLAA